MYTSSRRVSVAVAEMESSLCGLVWSVWAGVEIYGFRQVFADV